MTWSCSLPEHDTQVSTEEVDVFPEKEVAEVPLNPKPQTLNPAELARPEKARKPSQ